MADDRRPPTFSDACAAVLADPEGTHSVTTTLAPIYARTRSGEWGKRRARLVTSRFLADVDRVLELGCGVGTVLQRLGERYEAIGVDDRGAQLRFPATRGEAVVCGDPSQPPLRSTFDAVCAVEDATGRSSAIDLCVAGYTVLRPGGIAVIAAPTDPSAIAEPGVETYSGSRYLLERAVDVTDSAIVVDYRVTDRRDGERAVTTERRAVETTTADKLTAAFRAAGFEEVLVAAESDLPGVVVGRGVRPVDTGDSAEPLLPGTEE
jgi:SAM-dependent methyltransferase